MKQPFSLPVIAALVSVNLWQALAQGTAFTYQGRLADGGTPANGHYDARASVWSAVSGGAMLSIYYTNPAVAVSNGLFTVSFDFGPGLFVGGTNWLEIGVRSNGIAADFSTLSPRQQLRPVPYAVFAEGANAAGLSGTVPSASLAGGYSGAVNFTNPVNSFAGNGAALSNVNAATLGGLAASNFWQTTGNAGTTPGVNFLGTTDNKAFDLYANNVRALRLILRTDASGLYSNAPNVIGGSPVNQVSAGVVGGTVGGGGGNDTNGVSYLNQVSADFGTVSGGAANTASGFDSFIGGGANNAASGNTATIAGGGYNAASSPLDTVGGGGNNTASGGGSTVAGGSQNIAGGNYSAVAGGAGNIANATGSFIGGGGYDGTNFVGNKTQSKASTIGGGLGNNILGGSIYAVISGGVYNTNSGYGSVIGGGGYDGLNLVGNNVHGNAAVIGGGFGNSIPSAGYAAVISGGEYNTASRPASTVSGGDRNTASGDSAAVAGGFGNTASGERAIVGGGYQNTASGDLSFAAGTQAKAAHFGSFVWADQNFLNYSSSFGNGFFVRCTGGARFVTAIDGTGNATAGVKLNSGDTAWSALSDRNAKKNFRPVNGEAVLEKLAAMPVQFWNYKWEADTNTPHIGPMAQDFKAAFYPGRDDKSISTLEFDGVELAAIQRLNEKVQQLNAENAELKLKNDSMEKRLQALEQMIRASTRQ